MTSRALLWIVVFFRIFFWPNAALAVPGVDQVIVVKSERMLYLKASGEIVQRYPVALGPVPWGHKEREGDERTPEGRYTLDFKNPQSRFYKAIRVSYPSAEDRARAQAMGFNPGGNIMIHGQPIGGQADAQLFNWTDGCIAVSNEHMDEIWELVNVGTPIEILP
ncbi:MAG: L,D-transpeptidase family protein [Halioglobus sp.]